MEEIIRIENLVKSFGSLEVLKDIALNSFGISYRYKKKKGFIF